MKDKSTYIIRWDKERCISASTCSWKCLKNSNDKELCPSCELIPAKLSSISSEKGNEVEIVINGNAVRCLRGDLLIDVLYDFGHAVPALCRHPLLPPTGACRLCIVEITNSHGTQIRSSCDYEITESISVKTHTPTIVHHRKNILEWLLSEAPNAAKLKEIGTLHNLLKSKTESQESKPNNSGCILCGRCVQVSKFFIKCNLLETMGRSYQCRQSFAFDKTNDEACVLCGACEAVCPVSARKMQAKKLARRLQSCNLCVLMCPDSAIRREPETEELIFVSNRCKQCGLCAQYCPGGALHIVELYDRS